MRYIYAYLQVITISSCLAGHHRFYYDDQRLLQSQNVLKKYTNNFQKYIVSIQKIKQNMTYFGDNHFCAGIIIAPRYVLTSSHCVFDSRFRRFQIRPEDILLIAGTPNRFRPTKDTVILHVEHVVPYLSHKVSQKHDLAMLRLYEPIDLNVTKSLGFAELDDYMSKMSSNCIVLGWGQYGVSGPFAETLLELKFNLLSETYCHRVFNSFFQNSMLCGKPLPSASKDVCRGDSGGPLFCGKKLVGIVSQGVRCDRRFPTIFTAILPHRRWIFSVSGASSVRDFWLSMIYLILFTFTRFSMNLFI